MTGDYFVYHDPDFEGSFKGTVNKDSQNFNPVAMVNEAVNNTMQRKLRLRLMLIIRFCQDLHTKVGRL